MEGLTKKCTSTLAELRLILVLHRLVEDGHTVDADVLRGILRDVLPPEDHHTMQFQRLVQMLLDDFGIAHAEHARWLIDEKLHVPTSLLGLLRGSGGNGTGKVACQCARCTL